MYMYIYMYMCICVYIYMCVCVYIYVYMYLIVYNLFKNGHFNISLLYFELGKHVCILSS